MEGLHLAFKSRRRPSRSALDHYEYFGIYIQCDIQHAFYLAIASLALKIEYFVVKIDVNIRYVEDEVYV